MPPPYTLRVARPTNDIKRLLSFYIDGLGLQVLGEFKDHTGFDGIMLGHPQGPYHLEFTVHHDGHVSSAADQASSDGQKSVQALNIRAPTKDNLLTFYIPDRREWEEAVERMRKAGFESVRAFNPYWDVDGVTFEDPDGWRVVLQHAAWTA